MRGAWLFTPSPWPNEGILGYVRRLAQENGYPTVGYLLGGHYGKSSPGQVLNVLDPAIEGIYRTASDRIKTFPEKFNLAHRRICPLCWSKEPIELPLWEWKLGVACPEHHCFLIDSCSCCEQVWQGGLTQLSPCCEAHLRQCDPENAPKNVVALMIKLINAWEMTDVPLGNHGPGLTWIEWTHLVQLIGGYATRATAPRPSRPAGLDELVEARTIVSAAADALMNWPYGFKQYLDLQLGQAPSSATGPISLKKAFGRLYKHLFVTLKGEGYDGLRSEFAHYVSDHLPYLITRRNQYLLRYLDKPPSWGTLSLVSKRSAQSKRRVVRLVRSGLIDGVVHQYPSGRESILIRTVELDEANATKDALLTLATVSSCLGLKKDRVVQLIEAGLIKTAYGHSMSEQWAILRSSLEQLRARPEVVASERSLISLKQLLQRNIRTAEFVELIGAVVEGQLCLAIPSSEKISDWNFDRDVIDEWLKDRRRASAADITIPQAAIELGIKQQVVYHLVRVGLLQSEHPNSNNVGRVVTRSALESFRNEMIALSELAKFAHYSPRKMLVKLAECDVLPVTGPSVDGGRQYYIRRSDVPACFAYLGGTARETEITWPSLDHCSN